jgi:hypothetical protein
MMFECNGPAYPSQPMLLSNPSFQGALRKRAFARLLRAHELNSLVHYHNVHLHLETSTFGCRS